jgi:hypothetical protein
MITPCRSFRMVRGAVFWAALALPCTLAGSARAQPAPRPAATSEAPSVEGSGSTYSVVFVDDALNAMNDATIIPRIRVRPMAAHVTLIRPRAQFVTEMLKSVELM